MHRAIGYLSKRLLQVRKGESRKVLLTFLYFFLVITAYYVIKPVSRSLVLGDLGSRFVPYVDLISALLMGPMVALFARLVDRVEKRRLVGWAFWSVSGCLLIFWQCLKWSSPWIPGAFYVWVSIFSVLVVTLFWLVANDLYHPREAKRLFGFIGSGGILGGIVGSSIAAAGAKWLGTEQLLLLSAALLLVCWVVVQRLWRYAPTSTTSERASNASPETYLTHPGNFFKTLLRSRYLLLLVGLVGIAKIVSTLIYYQFNPFIEQMFPTTDAKTAFTGLFFGWMNIAAFLVQFLCTSWILRRLGLTVALLLLPVGLLGGSVGLLLVPTFWLAAMTELYDGSMNYSLQQTTKEVLYLPMDRSIRYKVKPFIDMVVFRFGKGIAAVLGIVCLDWWHLEARVLGYVSLPLIVAWVVLVLGLRHDYVKTIRGILQARAAARRGHDTKGGVAQPLRGPGTKTKDVLEQPDHVVLGNPLVQQKLLLASQLCGVNGALAAGGQELLEALAHYEQRPSPTDQSPSRSSVEQLKDCLQDPHRPMAQRRQAIKQLAQQDGQEAVDCLLGMLLVEEEAAMRHELLRGLVKLRQRYPHGLEFPKRFIRRQIVKETQVFQRITQIAAIYQQSAPTPPGANDPIAGLLRLLMEEATQQIFRLLSLIYRTEDISLIYTQLREPDAHVRADAIELLDNLLDPGLRWVVFPVLDEDAFLQRVEGSLEGWVPAPEEAFECLRQGVEDHNRWLSVLIVCLIGRLGLQPLLEDVERAAQRSTGILPLAARVARALAQQAPSSP